MEYPMNSRKWTPLFFPNIDPHKKRTILAILITFSWTVSAALILVGCRSPGQFWFLEAGTFFVVGLTFFEVRRNTGVPHSSRAE